MGVGSKKGRGSAKAPKAPDPKQTARAATSTNISTALANNLMGMMGQSGPGGSLSYEQTGTRTHTDPYTGLSFDLPQYQANQTLTGDTKRGFDAQTGAAADMAGYAGDRLRDFMGSPAISTDGLRGRTEGLTAAGDPTAIGNGTEARNAAEAALMERLNPQLDRDREALRTQLTNQGITMGSEAWKAGMDDFNRQSNDARLGAILNAGTEAQRSQGMDINAFNAANTARDRQFGENMAVRNDALNEQVTLRNNRLNEIAALLSGGQVSTPSFPIYQPSRAPTTDVAGLINSQYQAQAAQAAAQQQNRSGLFGNLISAAGTVGAAKLAGPAFLASDIRLKTDIREIGMRGPHRLYEYRYKSDPGTVHRGYMAHEVARIAPEALVIGGDGFLALDYSKLPEVA